jgi:hypothetical protein
MHCHGVNGLLCCVWLRRLCVVMAGAWGPVGLGRLNKLTQIRPCPTNSDVITSCL